MDDSSEGAAGPRRMPWILLGAACWGTFVVTGSGIVRAPFLLEMSRDLDASLTAVANLFSLTAFAWGIASLLAGVASDRLGRRPLLMISHALMIGGIVGMAFSRGYLAVALWTLVAGFGGGGHMGVIFAAVSDRVHGSLRGRAMGWIITGQSLSLVVGVPLATWIGTLTDWRGVMLCVAGADLVAALALRLTLSATESETRAARGSKLRSALPDLRLSVLLAAGVTERICFGVVGVYFALMLQLRYGLGLGDLAVPLAVMAAGNLIGNSAGGRLADRFARETCFALASLATAALAVALFAWDPGLVACVAIAFAYTFVNAAGRPAVVAVLSEVPPEIRGAMLGLNITCASVGWITAAAIGGILIDVHGVGSLAVLTAAMGVIGALLALWARRLAPVAQPA